MEVLALAWKYATGLVSNNNFTNFAQNFLKRSNQTNIQFYGVFDTNSILIIVTKATNNINKN
jgi:hypothetical protein